MLDREEEVVVLMKNSPVESDQVLPLLVGEFARGW